MLNFEYRSTSSFIILNSVFDIFNSLPREGIARDLRFYILLIKQKAPSNLPGAFFMLNASSLQLAFNFYVFVSFNNVAYFNVVKVLDVQTALIACIHFFNIVFVTF